MSGVGLPDLCPDLQERVSRMLPTRDILALSEVTWTRVLNTELGRRKALDKGITVISRCNYLSHLCVISNNVFRAAPYLTCRLELRVIMESFLSQLSLHNPSLAILHVPHLFDENRTLDISRLVQNVIS